jgi:pilus assembly protein CpaF
MRPDRIILGEVRGAEALDMLQAMNTGHDGSLSTIHSNSTRDALSRLETMVLMAGMDLPSKAIRDQIASAIHIVIQLVRFPDGTRKVLKLSEITGMEGDTVVMQDIFIYRQQGIDKDGNMVGRFEATGIRPKFSERFRISGIDLPKGIFDPPTEA